MDKARDKSPNLRDRLAQWDSQLAVLSEKQKASYVELSSASSARPLPSEVCAHKIINLIAFTECL